jgi:integrase
MMACIAKRRGRYVLDYYDNRGKRRWQTLKAGTTLKQAKDELRDLENRLAKGIYIPVREVPTFKKVATDWLEYKKANIRGSTWNMYRGYVENHFEQINDLKIGKITVATVEKFIANRREQSVSLPTLRKLLITFGQVMKYAIRHRYIDHNPVNEAEKPRDQGEEQTLNIQILRPPEIKNFLDATEDEKHHTLFLLALMSGARQGELFGLKWSDILWQTSQIHVQRTFNNGAWYWPKTKTSIRKIDVGPTVIKQLKKWKLACPPNKLDLVFPNKSGNPLNRSHVFRNFFWPALNKAELPRVRFHDLRHTYASLLIDQGENIKYIQKQLGHSKPSVTMDIYAHLMSEENPEAAKKLDDTIFQNGSKMVANS